MASAKLFGIQLKAILGVILILGIGVIFGPPILEALDIEAPLSAGPDIGDEDLGSDSAKWIIRVKDKLDSSRTVAGTVVLYSPSAPGEALETLTLSSGAVTTTSEYPEGKQFFCLYYFSTSETGATKGSGWLRYGEVVTMPEIDHYDSIQTLEGGSFQVYKAADSNDDIQGLRNSDKVWDNSTAALTSLNVSEYKSDSVPISMGVRVTNEDDNTAYVDPRGYYDYSVAPSAAALYADKASYLIVSFVSTNSSAFTLGDYVRFDTLDGGTLFQRDSTNFYMIVPLNTEMKAGVREVASGLPIQTGQLITLWNAELDWPTSMIDVAFTDIYTDDFDVEIALVSNFAFAGRTQDMTQSDMEIHGELDTSGTAWTNDWSGGGI